MRPLLVAATALALAALAPAAAHANCAAPVTYDVNVAGNTVTVCPRNFSDRACPDQGLLRVGADGRFKLADCDAEGCFVDECVAPGTYQYGFVVPYECASASCGTDYFRDATVTAASGSCERTAGRNAPAAFSGATPWGSQQSVCGYGGCGCANVPARVFAFNGAALLVGAALLRRRRPRA